VYEFLLSYVNQFLPPVGGLPLVHSLSLLFLAIFACNYARATGSRLALAACLLMLFHDPTNTIRPELSYSVAGKNDVLVAALVLQAWAVFLGRRNSQGPAWAVPMVLLTFIVSPRTLPDYKAYFYPDYRSAYTYFTDMPGQTIYS
jgi:hypothetical protein